jgi:hypothetical protein
VFNYFFNFNVKLFVFCKWKFEFFLGKKQLEQIDWVPWDDQREFGCMIDFRGKKMLFNIAIDA